MDSISVPAILPPHGAPRYATIHSSGADLIAAIDEPLELQSLQRVMIPTGLFIAVPDGFEAQVRPRSGMAWKRGITVLNAPGTVDADYRGEIRVILVNLSDQTVKIEPRERIAQLVIAPVVQGEFRESSTLPETARGSGGFGSTGV